MTKRLNKTNAKTLAVCYAAYLEAYNLSDHGGTVCWGDMLIEAQTLTGVTLISESTLRIVVGAARRRAAGDTLRVVA
jgi:hypothetical protein